MKSETHNPENIWAKNSPKEELNPGENKNMAQKNSMDIPMPFTYS
jgi:hypothetical protein